MTSPLGSVVVFVQAFDAASVAAAHAEYDKYAWARVVQMPSENNPFFESALFMEPSLRQLEAHVEFVGQISYKASTKIRIELVDQLIQSRAYLEFDYVHLDGPARFDCLRSPYTRFHPYFQHIWHDVLQTDGLPSAQVPEMLFNYWIARRPLWEAYCDQLVALRPRLLSHPYAFADSRYPGGLSKDRLQRLCGTRWYPHLPFVVERFPAAWFLRRQHKCAFLNRFTGQVTVFKTW